MNYRDLTVTMDIPATLHAEAVGEREIRINAAWDKAEHEHANLRIEWKMPMVDIQYDWYPNCRFDRSLRVDWYAPNYTKISSSAPVYCFYNAAGRNRFTLALSDVVTRIGCSLGVREEDGMLLCKADIPLEAGLYNGYAISMYRDYDDISFAEALRRVSLWWEKDCRMTPMNVPEHARTAMYSCWYTFHQATVAEDIEQECVRAKALGMQTVIVDDGWQTDDGNRGYAYCGDWEVTPKKIPDMKKHVENVHAIGMKYMLWYSVPYVGEYSKHWDVFKDKLLNYYKHIGVLDPRYPDVREYLIQTYVKALKAWNLDGFKLDFIDSFTSGDTPAPYKPEMDYVSVEDAVQCLMTDVMNALRAIKPDILIEFRQSYVGPMMRTYGNMFRVSDCPDDPISNRVGSIDIRMISGNTPAHSDMLMWHKDELPENVALQLLSIIFTVPQISVKLDVIPETHRRLLAYWLGFMEEHKSVLLDAPLEAEAPQNLYPLVRAEKDGKAIVVLYDGGRIVDMPAANDVWILNATPDTRTVLSAQGRKYHAVIRNCMGDVAEETDVSVDGIALLHIPMCGSAHLTEE